MLELKIGTNNWNPPCIPEDLMQRIMDMVSYFTEDVKCLLFLRIRPYIDTIYVDYNHANDRAQIKRFVFHDDYVWTAEQEILFTELCLNDPECCYRYDYFDEIFDFYDKLHPEWKLKRYYTDSMRLLDQIYHCMRKNTVKELLYKCGLDMLAKYSGGIDELDLLSSSPSEIYGGISIRVLRSLNCNEGGRMLCKKEIRSLIKKMVKMRPDFFDGLLNDAQCLYIEYLCNYNLTLKEITRLYSEKREELSRIWCKTQIMDFFQKVKCEERLSELDKIDRIYEKYFNVNNRKNLGYMLDYLLKKREQDSISCFIEIDDKIYAKLLTVVNDGINFVYILDCLLKKRGQDRISELIKIDKIYKKLLNGKNRNNLVDILECLLDKRDYYNRLIRVSNRSRNPEWQERDKGYIIRYPQTINDFCRESVYMSNCLFDYLDAMINNDTTILFMRKCDAVNEPFICIEIYENSLKQAYHSYNRKCTEDEISWLKAYCKRHKISCNRRQTWTVYRR
ncbi:MAG: PcfJ domain-containing protein [Butyrivibrio sp.]|nr:PcfJ domain-containing protein [Butyrivibrio sp.]